jgi:hypothetical protein
MRIKTAFQRVLVVIGALLVIIVPFGVPDDGTPDKYSNQIYAGMVVGAVCWAIALMMTPRK